MSSLAVSPSPPEVSTTAWQETSASKEEPKPKPSPEKGEQAPDFTPREEQHVTVLLQSSTLEEVQKTESACPFCTPEKEPKLSRQKVYCRTVFARRSRKEKPLPFYVATGLASTLPPVCLTVDAEIRVPE
ncbi:unnamed protein product [Cuscuta europaea]|uniref:Uncharacterized protein n=1 Tax=Cuscuta europaea TaxID=41803 RepID=A0A9P0Z1H3_CUSEU|nr:unnamed protein product [Cuscuta europaea]